MRFLLFTLLFFFQNLLVAQAPSASWVRSIKVPDDAFLPDVTEVCDMRTDAQGNTVVLGLMDDELMFDQGGSLIELPYYRPLFLLKYDPAGTLVLKRLLTQVYAPSALQSGKYMRLALDPTGNMYVASNFQNTGMDFDNGVALDKTCSNACEEIFVVKFNPAGDALWARVFGAENQAVHVVGGIAADPSGNVYVCGSYGGTSINFGPGYEYTNLPGNRFFFCKLSPTGATEWVRFLQNDSGEAIPLNLHGSTDGRLTITGIYNSTFKPGNGIEHPQEGSDNFFVAQYDNAGNVLWAHRFNSDVYLSVLDIAPVAGGVVYAVLDYAYSVKVNGQTMYSSPDTYGASLMRLDSVGVVSQIDVTYNNVQSFPLNTITTDGEGNVFGAGHLFSGYILLDTVFVTTNGQEDVIVYKMNPDGWVEWAQNYGATGSERIQNSAFAKAIGVDTAGNIYLNGRYKFGLGIGAFDFPDRGMFVMKLGTGSVAVNEPLVYGGFKVFPNPTTGPFTLQFDEKLTSDAQLLIFDQQGREVHRQILTSDMQLVQADFLPGMYTVQVINGDGVMVQKIVKTH